MNKKYVLYNPYAGNNKCEEEIDVLWAAYDDVEYQDMTLIKSYTDFFSELADDDDVIICGGDGTLHRFVNDVRGVDVKNDIYLYPVGSGNDFVRDLGKKWGDDPNFCINEFLKELPCVHVNGKEYLFVNGVGFGIGGYCCETGYKYREEGKRTDYAAIAVKGILDEFRSVNAEITVDGVRRSYSDVWLVQTMNGRFCGGGMIPSPQQHRICEDRTLSVMIMHGTGKLKTLMMLPLLFKGEHIKYQNAVEILTGREITVDFDRSSPLQIDGETVLNVSSYTAVIRK